MLKQENVFYCFPLEKKCLFFLCKHIHGSCFWNILCKSLENWGTKNFLLAKQHFTLGRSASYQSQRSSLSSSSESQGVATGSEQSTYNLFASSATEAKVNAFIIWRRPLYPSRSRTQRRRPNIYFHSLPRIWEEGVGGNLWSATVLRDRGWAARAGTRHAVKERVILPAAALWERQHVLGGPGATGFIPPQACLSQYGGGWLLNGSTWPYASPLSRSDFTGLPSQHPPAVLYAATPAPHSPPPPQAPPTHSLPPARSLQLDPLWMTPSQSA